MSKTACPAPESFMHWQHGELPAEQVDHLIEHVETCAVCLNTLEGLAAGDPIARQLRQGPPAVGDDDKAELAALQRRVRGVGPSTETTAPLARDTEFHFLRPPQASDEIGRLGPYRVLKVLGAGGMGVVYLAEDPGLKRMVAIKAMLPAIAASASAKKRFLREARAAAAIKHNHVVTIFQIGEERGVPFLAMESLEGESLEDRLQREATLPLAETLRIGREMAEGLAAAHALSLIHRDIKPGNTWLEGKQGHVKILDFGLARATTDDANLTQSGAILGTPAYMAPEQGNGDPDARSDLWSLGVVLYRMATGDLPFKGRDTLSTLRAVAMNHPPPPAQVNAQIPAGLSALVMKLLAKTPAKRIGSAQEVAEALRELEEDNSPGRFETIRKRARSRTPVLSALTGMLVLALIAAMTLYRPLAEDADVKGNLDSKSPPDSIVKVAPPEPRMVPKDQSVPKTEPATPPGPRTVSIVHQFQHAGAVTSVALSGDGKHVLTGSLDMTAILWEAATGKKIQTFQGHTQGITSADLSNDGKRALTGSYDKTAILWDTNSGTMLQIFQGHELGVTSVALSGDGKQILTGSHDKTAVLWEIASAKPTQIFQGHTDLVLGVALSADGKHVLTGSQDKSAILWQTATGRALRPFPGHTGAVTSVALSGDGKHAVTGTWGPPRGAFLWETANAKQLHGFQGHTTGVTSVALTGDGKFLLTGSADKNAILWDTATGKQLQTFHEHVDRVISVALNADGTRIVTGSDDKTAILWKVHSSTVPLEP